MRNRNQFASADLLNVGLACLVWQLRGIGWKCSHGSHKGGGIWHSGIVGCEVEMLLGERFNQRAYHDFILAQGLLPPEVLREAVLEEFVAAQ